MFTLSGFVSTWVLGAVSSVVSLCCLGFVSSSRVAGVGGWLMGVCGSLVSIYIQLNIASSLLFICSIYAVLCRPASAVCSMTIVSLLEPFLLLVPVCFACSGSLGRARTFLWVLGVVSSVFSMCCLGFVSSIRVAGVGGWLVGLCACSVFILL